MDAFQADNCQADNVEYVEEKAIPVWYNEGFETVLIFNTVLQNIQKHRTKNMAVDNDKIVGILLGRKKNGQDIEIQESLELTDDTDADRIIKNINSYNSGSSQLMGIYSDGKIPDKRDVSIIHALSKFLRLSLFLIKFDWSENVNTVEVFEGVFSIGLKNSDAELIFYQTSNRPFEQLRTERTDFNTSENLVKFLFPVSRRSALVNKELAESRVKMLKNLLKVNWKVEGTEDNVSYLKTVCDKAGMESVFNFYIPIHGENDRICCTLYLTCDRHASYSAGSSTIEDAHQQAALIIINCALYPELDTIYPISH